MVELTFKQPSILCNLQLWGSRHLLFGIECAIYLIVISPSIYRCWGYKDFQNYTAVIQDYYFCYSLLKNPFIVCSSMQVKTQCLNLLFFFKLLFSYSLHFPPSLTPTPAKPTSLPCFHPPPWFCPCVLYSSSWKPFPPYPPSSPLLTVTLFLISMSLVIFCLLFSSVDYVPIKGEIIWNLSLTAWLISLSIMLSSSFFKIFFLIIIWIQLSPFSHHHFPPTLESFLLVGGERILQKIRVIFTTIKQVKR